MLSSLFGDLGNAREPARRYASSSERDEGFAATTVLHSTATEVNARGQIVDRQQHDLVVSGSPAQAIREHFSNTRADLETASRLITLLDPVGVWGSAVIKALSDAGGRPIERLHLREQTTLRTLATIERTTLVQRHEGMLRVYHADVRAPGAENAEIPVALMERSHLTTIIIGPMQLHAVDALLGALLAAAQLSTWRCPHLLFMLPPSADAIASKITAVAWPRGVDVRCLNEPLVSASSVWNAMLGVWNQIKKPASWEPVGRAALQGHDFPIKVAELPQAAPLAFAGLMPNAVQAVAVEPKRLPFDASRTHIAMQELLAMDGLLGSALVDASSGMVLARASRDEAPIDLDLAAAVQTQVLRAHRTAARTLGHTERVDEVMSSAGPRQTVLRSIANQPELFLMALLDKQRANLALARFRLSEVEKQLA